MQCSDYRADELRFAFCYHAYLRWQTHQRRPFPPLRTLDLNTLQALVERFAIRLLECDSQPAEVRLLVSLQPQEALATCVSKVKGQVSKWLRQSLGSTAPATLLQRGYFACTSGKSTQEQVEAYLESQGEHHGYSHRVLPPLYVQTFIPDPQAQPWWQAEHACTRLQMHLVFATWRRRGVFGAREGAAVTAAWQALQREHHFALRKVSFLPDHVHLAVEFHPAVAPAPLVAVLMNASQRLLFEQFAPEVIRAGLERLWQPSAYLGSFGELASPQIQQYIRSWAARSEEDGPEHSQAFRPPEKPA
jgi:REP element-mobilizing transposase RayT